MAGKRIERDLEPFAGELKIELGPSGNRFASLEFEFGAHNLLEEFAPESEDEGTDLLHTRWFSIRNWLLDNAIETIGRWSHAPNTTLFRAPIGDGQFCFMDRKLLETCHVYPYGFIVRVIRQWAEESPSSKFRSELERMPGWSWVLYEAVSLRKSWTLLNQREPEHDPFLLRTRPRYRLLKQLLCRFGIVPTPTTLVYALARLNGGVDKHCPPPARGVLVTSVQIAYPLSVPNGPDVYTHIAQTTNYTHWANKRLAIQAQSIASQHQEWLAKYSNPFIAVNCQHQHPTIPVGRSGGSKLDYVNEAFRKCADEKRDYATFEECTVWATDRVIVELGCKPKEHDSLWNIRLAQLRNDIQKNLLRQGIGYQLKSGDIMWPT